jgi:CheY-like chemotaxis protein
MAGRMTRVLQTALGERVQLISALDAEQLVLADPGQIEQVILNLALNARDAMPDGGEVLVETRDVTLMTGEHPSLPPGDYVALVVTDTGTGIAEDVLPRVFEPFFTTKEKGRGTGLGLSMVEGIVSQSGGAVSVRSAPGKGATFTVLLPRATGGLTPAHATRESSPPSMGRFETVIVCDDEPGVRELVASVLELRAYAVLRAETAAEALELARRHERPVHLLVTDVAMPGMDGIELAAEIRKLHPRAGVLYMSGYTENAEKLSAPLGPNTHYLAKPFLPGDLTSLVSSILERPR